MHQAKKLLAAKGPRWARPRRLGWMALNCLDAAEEGREMEMKHGCTPEFQPQGLAGGHF